ncbi:hypothetical protein [Crateriforma conspicua]|uniref:Carbonic anhydrase 1 n=1 Tax=Crateriforma conspicua TaxID=2527996 RepID=A0A5C5Y983_9PLAN|nr:hypothetical protein [Crateriforma conspicua]TWT71479.1 Carbonic anhydrase 1 [Crateriforma conspicua]
MLQTIEKLNYDHGKWDCPGFPKEELRPEYFGDQQSIRASMQTETEQVAFIACSDHHNSVACVSGIPFERMIIIQTLCATLNTLKDVQSNCGLDIYLESEPIRHLIICGHQHCGFMKHWLGQNRMKRPDAEDVTSAVEAYTKLQLSLAATSPRINRHLRDGSMQLHGWVVDDATAQISIFNPATMSFKPQNSDSAE